MDSVVPRDMLKQIHNMVAANPQVELPLEHLFVDGIYMRTMFIPAGIIVVGKIHKRETINICLKGDISILTEAGISRFKAPYVVVSKAGIKKIGYAHQDTLWANLHATTSQDLDEIEREFITQDFDDPQIQWFKREVLK